MATVDVTLMRRWQTRRDADAFAEIVLRHSGMVYATCKRVLGNAADAEDAAQECFLRLMNSSVDMHSSVAAWLHTVALRCSFDRIKSERRLRRREREFTERLPPYQQAVEDDVLGYVDETIAQMPETLRTAIIHRFFEGRTHEAIAEDLGIAESTVRYRVNKGIEHIRMALKRRGVPMGTAGLVAVMSAELAEAAPASLTAVLGKLAIADLGATAGGAVTTAATAKTLAGVFVMKKIVLGTAAIATILLGVWVATSEQREKVLSERDASAAVGREHLAHKTPAIATTRPPAGPPRSASAGRHSEGIKSAPAAGVEANPSDALLGALFQSLWTKPIHDLEPAKSTDVPDNNAAHYFLLAAELFPDVSNERIMELLDMARAGSPIDLTELAEYVEKCRDSLAAIRAGLDVKNCQMPKMRSGEEPVPYLAKFRTLARLMDLQALSALQQGDPGAACETWTELLQFGNDTMCGAGLLAHLSGNHMLNTASNDIRAAVMAGAIPPEQLAAFLRAAEDIEAQRVPFSEIMAVDNAGVNPWWESLLRDPDEFRAKLITAEWTPDRELAAAMAAVPAEQLPVQLSQAVQAYRYCSELVALPYYEFARTYQEAPVNQNIFAQRLEGDVQPAAAAEARSTAGRVGTLLVGALQLYYGEHGRWPENIDGLAPAFLSQVPQDPFTGKPFRYQVRPDGFLLYSAGTNMQDDGGTLNEYDAPDGDLVIWPATP